ncbi:dTDP-4-dehydrorhamnose reductase [Legionella bononiensis]|uniref:dTDP-4-dehydrorhamnose reductase n=1 Tax=Legionella bononiensis TaxID=2793102 RepID=A0ABS1W883_9GAMM|nr:dTDP-4-dehydrorhamnose reductase [Legionella bononiensis]MBL7480036.1 dTDP-4-dehydrorhamnose reductase [Legionella bononiensis]MBL7525450.1 dTDP-4-dehydrorhamnose reductase [Legionella bononiensis]MBL7561633.1 dTDP-4-dehydrorhamnose reductase [Legionella bononiensis]
MKILVTGAKGQVGTEIVTLFTSTTHEIVSFTRRELNCENIMGVNAALLAIRPDLIINTAAYTSVDQAENEPNRVMTVNSTFVAELAVYCRQWNIPIIHLSTDYVFDGTKFEPYKESDIPNPQNVYGRSKLAGEQAIFSKLNHYIILRVSWVFGTSGSNFVKTILNLASSRDELNIVSDQWGRPTAARDIARVLLGIVQNIATNSFDDWGIYHYASHGVTNWFEFAHEFINMAKEKNSALNLAHIHPIKSEEYVTKVKRPKYSVLDTSKIQQKLGIDCHHWYSYLPEVVECCIK